MKLRDIFEIGGNSILYVLTATQTKEIFQIVELCLSILVTLVILFSKIYQWYKNAKEDGKITKEEIKELIDLTEKDIKDTKEDVDKLVDAIQKQEEENNND